MLRARAPSVAPSPAQSPAAPPPLPAKRAGPTLLQFAQKHFLQRDPPFGLIGSALALSLAAAAAAATGPGMSPPHGTATSNSAQAPCAAAPTNALEHASTPGVAFK
jgi:hypothetical protein